MSDLKNVGNCVKCRVSVLINVHVVVEVAVLVVEDGMIKYLEMLELNNLLSLHLVLVVEIVGKSMTKVDQNKKRK